MPSRSIPVDQLRRAVGLNSSLYLRRETPVIVYSLERTGTVSLFRSLTGHGITALATHHLGHSTADPAELSGSARWATKHIVAKRRPVKIISLVRNPIDNMLSTYARSAFIDSQTADPSTLDSVLPVLGDLTTDFVENFLETGRYRQQLDWFDTEFRPALGIDVYQHPFDTTAGFSTFSEGPCDVLIVRTEMDDERKAAAIADFLDEDGFSMADRSDVGTKGAVLAPGMPGKDSPYGAHYAALRAQPGLFASHIDEITASPYVQHFFAPEAIADMSA